MLHINKKANNNYYNAKIISLFYQIHITLNKTITIVNKILLSNVKYRHKAHNPAKKESSLIKTLI
jgi:hypothetical protein